MEVANRIAELEAKIAKLEAQLNPVPTTNVPHPRFDPTAGMSMPAAAMAEMTLAVSDSTLSDVVADSRRRSPNALGPSGTPPARGSGWYQPQSLEAAQAARTGAHWPKPGGKQ